MDILEVLEQVRELLQQKGRVSYRILKRQFALDDEALDDLRYELVEVDELAVDKDGKMLIWNGEGGSPSSPSNGQPQTQSPASYTPQHLAERILAEQAAMESRGSTNGERKTITALFADLKGSTALIEGLDPEDARAIIDPALQLMMDAVHRYDGYVAQALGDGIFALFGAPIAHEDHPQRALYAALRMQEEMQGYADRLREQGCLPLLMRVGLNTGEVVVRSIRKDDLHADYVPVGHSTNLAARMEQLAAPGSIVVSAYTHKLTDGYFAFKDLGKTQIKGAEEPLNVYEVLGTGPLRTRLQVSARRGLSRFVGRHSELDQMQRALEQGKAGHGQIVGVMGEPGLGKSRLFYEFKLTAQSGCLVLEAFSVSHGRASPYLPLIELLKDYFAIEPPDDERKRREKIRGKVLALDRSLEDTLPYLFALLGIEDEQSPLQQMDAQIRRQRTFEALKKLLLRESLNQPLLLIFEDLHWIDTETQGFLDVFSESVASANLVLLVNYRPEYRHEWGGKTYYTQLRLAPLGQAEAAELLRFLLGSDASLTALQALILERTEGSPFFMEEVVQTLAEEGTLLGERGRYRLETTPTALHISPTVHGVLAARIDRLTADEKALLQQLSVIGRQFPISLVHQVVAQSEADLYRILSSLQAKEFLYEQPAFPEVEYFFKHALTQDVTYGTVLHEQRKALHEQTGRAIEALYKDALEDHYTELAYHYQQSEHTEKAVEYLGLAGHQAMCRSAYSEAIRQVTTALDFLQALPPTPHRDQHELRLQTTLGMALMASKGISASEAGQAYERARTLCQQTGDTQQLFTILMGLRAYYMVRAELPTAFEIGEQLMTLAQNQRNSSFLAWGYLGMASPLLYRGEFASARRYFEQGFTAYYPPQQSTQSVMYLTDIGMLNLVMVALPLWFLGYPAQANQRVTEALARAHELPQPDHLAFVLSVASMVFPHFRDSRQVQQLTETGIALSTEHGFSSYLAQVTAMHGWALAKQGQSEAGVDELRQGLAALRDVGAIVFLPLSLALFAETYGDMGQSERGFPLLTQGLDLSNQTTAHWYTAELYRLKGEMTLQSNDPRREAQVSAAEVCFQKAIETAQQQEAKSWELRAATSLARLWQSEGKTTEARDLLAPVYDWFTEGFDTADLKDAKALLQELAEGH